MRKEKVLKLASRYHHGAFFLGRGRRREGMRMPRVCTAVRTLTISQVGVSQDSRTKSKADTSKADTDSAARRQEQGVGKR